MRNNILKALIILLSQLKVNAQYNTLYQHYYTPVSGQALPVITLYPNPAMQELVLQGDESIRSVNVFNMLGQAQNIVRKENNKLDISSLKSGTYLIDIKTEKQRAKSKFVKE